MITLIITSVCSLIIGLVAYYIGYMTGTEREHDRLCTQFMREKREDGE
jgi:hypothetical protein